MTDRQKRLTEVYDYLSEHGGIHTQTDFAIVIGYSRPVISSALNGSEIALTDKLFHKICEVYPKFNIDYLLSGEGALFSIEPIHESDVPPSNEMGNVLELYARMIRGVDDLRVQLKDELTGVQSMKDELKRARDEFREATIRLDDIARRLSNRRVSIAADDSDL
jgi:hypothetical protein